MSSIAEFAAERVSLTREPSNLILDLDVGLANAGRMAELIYDLAVFPNPAVDPETIAAAARSLLAYLVGLGAIVDALEPHERAIGGLLRSSLHPAS